MKSTSYPPFVRDETIFSKMSFIFFFFFFLAALRHMEFLGQGSEMHL